jgi:hypothetical protein
MMRSAFADPAILAEYLAGIEDNAILVTRSVSVAPLLGDP